MSITPAENAANIMRTCLGVKQGEQVLIVTDNTKLSIGKMLYDAALALSCDALLMQMEERELSGQEPPAAIAAAMKAADVVICPTAKSLTHTNARIEAAKAGARIATMPGISEEMFTQGAMTANYTEVAELTEKVTALLTDAKEAHIEKGGYTLTIVLEGRNGVPSAGVYREPGQSGNLPSGEAYIAPLENSSNGEVLVDGSMIGIGMLEEPLLFTVKNGKLVNIKGSEKLSVLLENERNATLCELGVGTNKNAVLCGVILEDEKVYGTVHIAFGTNTSFGGVNKADCHMDGVILQPNLYLDGKLIIQNGKFMI